MKNKKEAVAAGSVFSSLLLTSVKFVVGFMTGSMGIMSEAAHSLLDMGAAILTYFAVKFGDKPADDSHPYGHGKIESVSALIETGLLFVTSAIIIYEAIIRLASKNVEIEVTWYAYAVVIFSILIDYSRSGALYRVAKKTNSQALEADALHFSSDIWSSAVVLVGLAFVSWGIKGADAIAALAVALFVIAAGYRLGKRTIDVLVDTAPQGIAQRAEKIAGNVPGVISAGKAKVRPLGPNVSIEIPIEVNRKFNLSRAHEIRAEVERKIKKRIPKSEVSVRTVSVQMDDESIAETIQMLASKNALSVHDVVVDEVDGKQFVSYHVEMPSVLTISKAHDMAGILEQLVRSDLGEDVEIISHIEPARNESVLSSNVSAQEMEDVLHAIDLADGEIKDLSEVHNVLVRKAEDSYFVSFHCFAPPAVSLESVHEATNRFEEAVKARMKEIKRVIIHVEPAQ